MKKSLTVIAALLCAVIALRGQTPCDTLLTKDGQTVLGKILSQTKDTLSYTPCDSSRNTLRFVAWNTIEELRYAGGGQKTRNLRERYPDSTWVSVETTDGNEFEGVLHQETPYVVVMETDILGKISINRPYVRSVKIIRSEQIKKGTVWPESPHATRYLYGPNGYGLRKGEAYYQNVWVLFNQATVGLSNQFSIGLGVVPVFLFSVPTPMWITPKFSIPIKKDKVNLGVGVLAATVVGSGERQSFGVAYGQLTLGSRDRNVNFGFGYGYISDDWANSPTMSLSAMLRINKKLVFLSENYLFDTGSETVAALSAGMRFLTRHIAIDGAFVAPIGLFGSDLYAIPWLGVNVPLGTGR